MRQKPLMVETPVQEKKQPVVRKRKETTEDKPKTPVRQRTLSTSKEKAAKAKETTKSRKASIKEEKENVLLKEKLETQSTQKKTGKKITTPKKKSSTTSTNKKALEKTTKFEETESQTSEKSKLNLEEEPTYSYKESILDPSTYVITLTPKGEIYIDPVPRYTDFITFRNFLVSAPDIVSQDLLQIRADIKVRKVGEADLVYSIVSGTRKLNPYADKFLDSPYKINIGGSLVFTGDGKGFTKEETKKMFNYIVNILQSPDIIYFREEDD